MSQALIKNKHFIISLLKGKIAKRKKELLFKASPNQLKALAEIFYNIGNLPLQTSKRKKLLRYKALLKDFVNELSERHQFVKKHYRIIFKILRLIKSYLYIILQ